MVRRYQADGELDEVIRWEVLHAKSVRKMIRSTTGERSGIFQSESSVLIRKYPITSGHLPYLTVDHVDCNQVHIGDNVRPAASLTWSGPATDPLKSQLSYSLVKVPERASNT